MPLPEDVTPPTDFFLTRMEAAEQDYNVHVMSTRWCSFLESNLSAIPAFAMTINKAQGQALQHMGLYLPKPMFSRGQLYVALFRVGSSERVTICVVDGRHEGLEGVYTKDIVYKEVFYSDA